MIDRPGVRPITAAAWRNLVHASIEDGDIPAIMGQLVQSAREGNPSAVELVLRYTAGTPYKCPAPSETLNLPELTSYSDCMTALNDLLQAEANNTITAAQAKSYRETIMAATGVLRAEQQEQLEDALSEQGSTVVFTRAGEDIVESFKTVLDGRGEQN